MSSKIMMVERRVRSVAVVVTVALVLAAGAVQAGLISRAPSYNFQAWYLVTEHTGFLVTSEYADEAACQRKRNATSVCQSGRTLIDHERNKPAVR
ncbi:MAG: hypothetical protein H7315_09120 [Herminiimonas sp.]|nr:hypothetical protein [Herminiimonas sp.]